MRYENYDNGRRGESPRRGGMHAALAGNRLRGLRTAGLFLLFALLLISFVFGFGLNRGKELSVASAATDWGASWNTAVSESNATTTKTLKLTEAWTTTSGTKTGAGFSSNRIYVPSGKNLVINLNGYTINRALTSANTYGSVIYVEGTLTLTGTGYIRGGYVNGSNSSAYGGGIHIASGGVVNLDGPTIGLNQTSSTYTAAGVYVAGGGTLNLKSGSIGASSYANTASNSYSAGGVYVANGGVVNMSGGNISYNKVTNTYSGGGVYVTSGGVFNKTSGNLSYNSATNTYSAGGAYLSGSGKLTQSGGNLNNNTASNSYSAGGVYVANGATFAQSGGYVSSNSASATQSGGGVRVVKGGTFEMTGGYMRTNVASGTTSGGAVYLDGAMKNTGGTIGSYSTQSSSYYNNASNSSGAGGVYVTANGTLSVGGSGNIYNNLTANAYTKDIFFAVETSKLAVISTISSTSYKYGVYKTGTGSFTTGCGTYCSSPTSVFYVQNASYSRTTLVDNNVTEVAQLHKTSMSELWSYFVQRSIDTKTQQTVTLTANWTASSNSFGTGTGFETGRIYVPADADIVLKMNAYTIDRGLGSSSANNYGNTFVVLGKLSLQGDSNNTSIIKGAHSNGYGSYSRGAIYVSSGGTLTIGSGVVIGSNRYTAYSTGYQGAGGVYVTGSGTVNMSGGYIGNASYPNTAASSNYSAGGINVYSGTFNFTGGYIWGNTSSYTYGAGAIYAAASGIVNMSGGYIYSNTASSTYSSGAVYLAKDSTASFTGGRIGYSTSYTNKGNSTNSVGGVYAATGSKVSLGGSVNITNNAGALAANFYFESPTGNAKVVSAFSSAKIWIARSGNSDNYAVSAEKRNFTTDYSKYNTAAPSTFFVADAKVNSISTHEIILSENEASFKCRVGSANWSYAVARSLADKSTQTVTLVEAWTGESGSMGTGTGYDSGRMYVPSGASIILNLNGYTVNRGLTGANNYGSVIYVAGTLTIKGTAASFISGGYSNSYYSSTRGSGIHIYSGGIVNMEGGVIAKNTATGTNGGAVVVGSGGTFNFKGGYIGKSSSEYNTATGSDSAGGVTVMDGGTFNMSNAVATPYIYYNRVTGTKSGGGVYVQSGGKFNMSFGYIRFNNASNTLSGGGVYLAGTMEMTGGHIGRYDTTGYGNTASNTASGAGGVYYASGSLSIGGDSNIYNNISGSSYGKDIIFASESLKIKCISAFNSTNNRVGIYKTGVGAFTTDFGKVNNASYYSYFFANYNANYTIGQDTVNSVVEVALVSQGGAENWSYAVQKSLETKAQQTVTLTQNWSGVSGSMGSGTGYDNGRLYVPAGADIVLKLGGNTINRGLTSANNYGSVFYVAGTLTIEGNTSSWIRGGFANGYYSSTRGGGIHIASGGVVNFKGGIIAGNRSTSSSYGAGGIYISGGGTLNMTGGYIGYNTTAGSNVTLNNFNYASGQNSAGGVYVGGSGVFNYNGGYIYGNQAAGAASAGGVFVYESGLLNIAASTTHIRIGYDNSSYQSTYRNYASVSSSAGGVYIMSGANLTLGSGVGYNICIDNNTGGIAPNLYFAATTGYAKIGGSYGNGYKIGVTRAGNADNYAVSANQRRITQDYSKYISADATYYFRADATATHYVEQKARDGEAVLHCKTGPVNWSYAVARSLSDKSTQTVTLEEAWSGSSGSMGTGTGFDSGRIYVPSGASMVLNLAGYTVNRGLTSNNNYGSVMYVVGTLTVQGSGTIQGGYANGYYSSTRGGGVHIGSGGTFNLEGTSSTYITKNTATGSDSGAGVHVASGGIFNFKSGWIGQNSSTYNTASGTYSAGGVYVASGGVFNMTSNSANIRYNRSTNSYSAGGVNVASGGTFNMSGGYLRFNYATGTYSGGGVYLAGVMKMTGGQIGYTSTGYYNTADNATSAGGLYYAKSGNLSLGGSAVIYENITAGSYTKDIVFAYTGSKINIISQLTTSYAFGIYKSAVGAFTSGYGTYNTASVGTYFINQNGSYTLSSQKVNNVTEAALTSTDGTENWSQAIKFSLADGSQQTVTLTKNWTVSGSFTPSATGTSDGYDSGRLYVPAGANVVLNLNGYSVNRGLTSANNYGSVFYVAGTLTITGNTSSVIQGGYANGYYSSTRGGGIHVASGGIVNFQSGVIGNNKTSSSYGGGGVYITSGGTFNMSGGYIGYSTSTPNYSYGQYSGAGVYVSSGGTFNMTGGSIRCNISSGATSAAGIYASGTVKITNGQVGYYYNSSYPNKGNGTNNAGGIYVTSSGILQLGGRTAVYNNTGTLAPNVYFATATNKATITSAFTDSGYKIGVKRLGYADNYAANTNRNFTVDWSKYNSGNPTSYFVCDNTDTHKIVQVTDKDGKREGAFECTVNHVNWSNAVKQSKADGLEKTVSLTGDWVVSGSFTSDVESSPAGYDSGRLYVDSSAKIYLNMNGHVINRGLSSANNYGSVFAVFGSLTIDGNGSSNSIIRGGYGNSYYTSSRAGGIYVGSPGNVTIKNYVTIRNNTVSGSNGGGGVYVNNGGTFTMQGSYLYYNYSTNTYSGAAAGVGGGGKFIMESGAIYYNKATGNYSAGGVYVASNGTFQMTGGQLGNYNSTSYANVSTPTNGAGGVYVADGGILNTGGTANIRNNGIGSTVTYNTRDVYLTVSTQKINVISKHTNSSYKIGVYRTGNGIITSGYGKAGNTSSPSTYYVSENTTYSMLSEGSGDTYEGSLLSSNDEENWSYAVRQSLANKGAEQTVTLNNNWKPSSGSFGTGTGYSNGRLYVPSGANIVLNLNGKTIDRNLTSVNNYGSVFYVEGTLTIHGNDSSYIRGGYTNGYYSSTRGAGIHIYNGGTVNMDGGYLVYNRGTGQYCAGGVYVSSGATFNMTGGKIGGSGVANSVTGTRSGAGVYVANGGKFVMSNKTTTSYIYYNTASGTYSAGGVYLDGNATFEMQGGYIGYSSSAYNTASGTYSAGGVYNNGGTFKMTGGYLRNNRATNTYSAGAVYVNSGTFEMTGGSVGSSNTSYANYATNSGGTSVGGVYVNTNGKVSLGGAAYIYGNQTYTTYTGNLYFANSTTSATVVSPFTSAARIYVYRTSSVVTQPNGSKITSGYEAQNPSTAATSYFFADVALGKSSSDYRIGYEDGEAIIYYLDPVTNWEVAVNTSSASDPKTVKLFANWTAGTNSNYTTAFSVNSNGTNYPFYQGTLNVPSGRSVILDLNGFTLSRGLNASKARANGYVLGVRGGTLKIIDSSQNKGGFIKGGSSNSATVGSGIYVYSGTLTLEGGRITDNYGSYGVYVNSSSKINLGGDIGIYNNKNASNNAANLYMSLDTNMINIVSELTSEREIGITRTVPYDFTKGWGKFHGDSVDPELHFSSDDPNFRIGPTGAGDTTEVAILGNDNASNWQYAVTTSLKTGKTYTVQLTEDWSAGKNTSYGTAFGINTTAYYYGALYVPSGASIILDLNGCTVDRKLTTGNVFNVVGKLQIVDLSASKNGIVKGGSNGFYIYNGGTVTMNAGTVTNNAGYGVHVYNGTFNMTAGTVSGNTTASVYVERNGRINLGGKPIIDNNMGSGNLVLAYESTVIGITSQMQEGAKVSFLRKGVGQLTSGWSRYNGSADPWSVFTSESDVFLASTEEVSGSLEAFLISYDNNINWQYAVTSSLSSKTTKSMRLYEDWVAGEHTTYTTAFGTTSAYINGALYVPKGASVELDLCGFDLDRALLTARANGYIVYVQGELKIYDSRKADNDEGALITGGNNNSGSSAGAVYIGAGGVFTLQDAQIKNNAATSESASAGAVYAAGTFNFESGSITSNEGANTGGIYVTSAGSVNMTDGAEISLNAANGATGGGAVYAAGAFALKGGTITANSGTAGGVYVASGGNLALSGGKISGNNGKLAGGVYVYNSASANFAMSGGEITENIAIENNSAGGVYVAGKAVIMGGKIGGNLADDGASGETESTEESGASDKTTAGGIFVAGTGNLTLTGGEVAGNKGTNGVRGDSSATVNLGGSAVVKDNGTIDLYMTNGTRAVNIVSKFEDGAEIGVWRDKAGSFTKGYGIYNGSGTGVADPNEYFFSNKTIYNIFQTEAAAGESVEVAAGIPADRPTAIDGDDTPVYNGQKQLIVTGYDATKMSVSELPEGVELTSEGFVATHAGTYALTFTPGSDYCWTNGTNSAYKLNGVIAPKPVSLSWTNLEYTYDTQSHKPDAEVSNLVGSDKCGVTVSGEQTDAGTYTATASKLDNSDYTLDGGTETTHEFVIHKAPMTLTFEKTTAVFNEKLTLSLSGNLENGAVTYSVEDMTGKAEIEGTDGLMPTWVGEVKVTANVAETKNYLAGTVSAVFTIEQAEAPLKLAENVAIYGTPLTLGVVDYGEVGVLTFTVEEEKTGKAEITANVLDPKGVGTVDIRISVEETHNYKATSAVETLTVKPRIVTLSWSDTEFVYDGDPHCAKAEITNLVAGDECNLQVVGAQTDAGTYNATAKSLDNQNYTLTGAEETVKEFVIHKANIVPVVNTTEITFKKTEQISIDGNLGNGGVKLTVLTGGTGNATASGDTLTGTWVGTIDVQVEIAETKNYLGSTLTVSIEVLQADPELALDTKEAVYGTDLKLTISGNEENGTITYALADGETKAGLSGDTLTPFDIGDVEVTVYVEETHNYKAGTITETVTIKPRPVTVIWTKLEFDYDGNEHAPEATITGLVEGDTCTVIVLGGQTNAGTHTAMADSLGNPKYTLIGGTDVTTKFTIKPCAVTLSWNQPDFTYNGEMQTPTATVVNLIGTDECTVTVLGTKDAGDNLTAMATGLSNPNYTLDGGSNLVTSYKIKPLPVVLEWTDTELVYNAAEQKPTATVKNLCGTDKCDVIVIGAQTNVGEYTATAFGLGNPNYTLEGGSNLSCDYEIKRAPITVQLVDNVLTYGTEATLAVEGNLGNGDVTYTVENGTGTATSKGSYILPTKVGTITVTATVAETANYEAGSVTAVVIIQPRSVTLGWEEDMSFVYNGDEQAPKAWVTNLLEGDSCTVVVSGATNVGTDLVATASSLSNENYTLANCPTPTTTFDIVPLRAELSWSNFELTYNGKEQAPTAIVSNLIGADKCEVTVAGATDVGNDWIASAISLDNPNYTLEGCVSLTAEFKIKPLVADIAWSDTKLTYNAEEQAPTATVSNLCDGDSCLVTVSGAQINAGTYTATAAALSNPNYTLSGASDLTTPYTIEKAKRTVTLLESETIYGTSLTLSLVGNSESGTVTYQVSGGTGAATMSGSVFTPTRAGEVVLTVTVAETQNYQKTVETVSVTVKPKTIGLSWQNTEFTYDGSEKKPTATATGLVGSDKCEVIVSGGQTDAGAYLATASGVENTNYTLEGATETTCAFTINKANITVKILSTRTTYGTPLTIELSGNLGDAPVIYTVTEETGSGVVDGKGVFTATSFGTVTITADVAESKNYYGGSASGRIIIDKGPAPIELETPTAVYGTPLVLVLSGTDEDGKLTYAVQNGTGEATLSGNILLPTKIGTVMVVVKMTATDNFVETIKSFTVTVKPRPVELVWAITDFTYNGQEQTPSATVVNLVEGDTCEVTVKGQTDAGMEQEATATAVSNENYTLEGSSTASTKYVIKQKVVTLDWGDTEFVYNGEEQAPEPTVTNLEGSDECEVTVTGAQTDAGDYFADATALSNPNYTLEGAENVQTSFHIDRMHIEVTITTTQAEFGKPLKLETSGNIGGGEESFTVADGTGSAELAGDTLTPKKIGTVTVTVNVGETANTYGATATAEITIQKGKANIDFLKKSTVYGTSLKLELTGNEENGDYTYTITDDTGSATLGDKDTLVPIKAGLVTVKVVVKETDNYDETEFEAQITIEKLVVSLEWAEDALTYNGQEQAPEVTVTNLVAGDECKLTVSGVKDAGKDLTAEVTELSNENYTIEGAENLTCKFEIAPIKAELEWGDDKLEYSGSAQAPEVKITNLQGDDTEEDAALTVTGAQTAVGQNYMAIVESVSSGNYTLDGVANLIKMFEITKAHLTIEIVAGDAVYNVPMQLAVTGNIGGGAVTYEVTEGPATVTGDMLTPTGTDDPITVVATVAETDNYFAAQAKLTFNAGKGKANYDLATKTVEYGSDLKLTVIDEEGNEVACNASFEVAEGSEGAAAISGDMLTPTRAGTLTLNVNVDATGLYLATSFTAQIVITPMAATVDWSDTEFVYNGEGHVPTATVANLLTADKGKVEVVVEGMQTDAGTHTATAARLTGDNAVNYVLSESGNTTEFKITKAEINPVITLTRVYCQIPAEITLEGNSGNGDVTFTVIDGGTGAATISGSTMTPTVEGSVIVRADIAESKNYKGSFAQAVIVIEKKKLTLGLLKTEVTYGSELTLTVTGNDENGALTFSVINDTGSATVTASGVLKGTGAGTVNVVITVAETSSYQSSSETVKVTVLPRQIGGISWATDTELVYNGEAQAPVATATGLISGDECTVTVTGGKVNAGTYAAGTAQATGLSNPNYTLGTVSGTSAPAFTIQKADPTIMLTTQKAVIGVPLTLEVSGNDGNGTVKYEIVTSEDATGTAVINGNVLNGSKLGKVYVRVTVSETTNYNEAYWNGTVEIEVPAIPLELTQTETVYGDNLKLVAKDYQDGVVQFTLDAGGTGAAEISGNTLIPKKVGTVIVILSVGASDTYQGNTEKVTVTIKPREVGVTWGNLEMPYNGKEQVASVTLSNLVTGDVCDVTIGGAARDAGKHTATITMLGNDNYVLATDAEVSKEFEIKPLTVSLEWTIGDYTYNGKEQAPDVKILNLIDGDTCELTVKGQKDASEAATATVTELSDKNYTLEGCENVSATFAIKKKTVSLQWTETALMYNGKAQAPVPDLIGLVEGDDCELKITGEQKDVGTDYTATVEGILNDNYELASTGSTKFSIKPYELEITADNLVKTYDGEYQMPDIEFTPLNEDDDVELVIGGLGEYGEYEVGKYDITLSLSGSSKGNYAIKEGDESLTFEITPMEIAVLITPKDVTVLYEGAPITADDIKNWYELELQGALAPADAGLNPDELFKDLALKPVIKLGTETLSEVTENGIYVLTPEVTDEAVVCGNYALKLLIDPEDETCDLIVSAVSADVLTLKEDSKYQFIAEVQEGDAHYRRTYEELNWTHGVDDVGNVEAYVVGQVMPETTIKEFLSNFIGVGYIKLYDKNGTLLYDCGKAVISEDLMQNSDLYRITTGSYIRYFVNGIEKEKVYVSILGDVDGDGYIGTRDITRLNQYIKGVTNDGVCYRLSGYIVNSGAISSFDLSEINQYIKELVTTEDFIYRTSKSQATS